MTDKDKNRDLEKSLEAFRKMGIFYHIPEIHQKLSNW